MCPRALITGAGKRIGRAVALAFASAGYRVVVHYHRSREEAESLCRELSARNGLAHECHGCDLTSPGAIEGLFDRLAQDGTGLDVVVNNASCYRRSSLSATTPSVLAEDFGINFQVPLEVMRVYRSRFSSGQVINLLDYRVELADPHCGGYGLAKKALKEATLAAALEWAPAFRVNGIAPGLVLPPPGISQAGLERLEGRIPTGRRTSVEEIGRSALFLCETPSLNGQILYVDGGLHLLGANATGERVESGLYEAP